VLTKYDYRVHYGKFFHSRPEIFKTVSADLESLKTAIDVSGSTKFINCWNRRVIYGDEVCENNSNYEKFADVMDERLKAKSDASDEL